MGDFPLPQWCASWFFASPPVALAMLRISSPYSPISLSTRSEMTFILELSWCDSFRNTTRGHVTLGYGQSQKMEKKKRTILDNEMTKLVAPLPPQIVSPKKSSSNLKMSFESPPQRGNAKFYQQDEVTNHQGNKKKVVGQQTDGKAPLWEWFQHFHPDSLRQPQTAPDSPSPSQIQVTQQGLEVGNHGPCNRGKPEKSTHTWPIWKLWTTKSLMTVMILTIGNSENHRKSWFLISIHLCSIHLTMAQSYWTP